MCCCRLRWWVIRSRFSSLIIENSVMTLTTQFFLLCCGWHNEVVKFHTSAEGSQCQSLTMQFSLRCKDNNSEDPFFAMWNMQEFGIQIEWSITATRTLLTTRSTRSTRSTTRNPTMCAATWNSGRTREHARSVAVFVVSLCFAVVPLVPCTSHTGPRCLRLRLIPSHGHHHVACMNWACSLTSSTSSSTSFSSSSSSLSSCTSCCLSLSSSLMSWTTTTRTAAEELGPRDNEKSSTG